ncbi:hypothetical protein M0R45_038160 [Rubus argutus]|uniref:Uncharacterized protein n=1 Tax=Rubus argutus TaxID=59490 RepID=A0AAW1W5P9_RUBAR
MVVMESGSLPKGSLVVARGKRCCTLYKTYGKICKSELNAVENASPSLWHRRLGHMSEKGLQVLAKKSLIPFVKEKVWTGKSASYSHLKVFGCKAFALVPKEQRSKLDDKATPCIFLGYGDEEFGYRLWDPKANKFIRSRDVVFHEDQTIADLDKKIQPTDAATKNPTYKSVIDEQEPDNEPDVAEPEAAELIPEPESEDDVDQEEPNQEEPNQGEQAGECAVPQVQRRSNRARRPPIKYPSSEYILMTSDGDDPYAKYILMTSDGEPEKFEEAITHKDSDKWMMAMQSEMESLLKNGTYELVKLPKGRKALKNKWVFKLKKDENQQLTKFKARLVVKGFEQKEGVDFDEIFSPVVKMTSIREFLGHGSKHES